MAFIPNNINRLTVVTTLRSTLMRVSRSFSGKSATAPPLRVAAGEVATTLLGNYS